MEITSYYTADLIVGLKLIRLKNLNKLGLMQIASYYTADLIAGLKLTIIQQQL